MYNVRKDRVFFFMENKKKETTRQAMEVWKKKNKRNNKGIKGMKGRNVFYLSWIVVAVAFQLRRDHSSPSHCHLKSHLLL